MNRLSFLKGLAGLPLIAALAPLIQGGQQEAQSVSGGFISATASLQSVGGVAGAQIEQLPAGQFAEPVSRAIAPGLPVGNEAVAGLDETAQATYVSYSKDFAGDWAGFVEAADRSWINFISKDGFTISFIRNADGSLRHAVDKAEDVERLAAETLPKLQNNGW